MADKKTYVLDTSVLMSSPKAPFTFAEHEVVLPLVVVKELEGKRNDPEIGHTARAALHHLEGLRKKAKETGERLSTGVIVNDLGGTVRIETNHIDQSGLPESMRDPKSHDARILAVANSLRAEGKNVVLISKDMPMRILADGVLGIPADEYKREQVYVDDSYTGIVEVEVERDLVNALYEDKRIPWDLDDQEMPPVNTGLILKAYGGSALARLTPDKDVELVNGDIEVCGVKGRSAEQRIAMAHLRDKNIGIVSLGGPAGTGKSVVALAAGLEAVLERNEQKRIVVFRSLFAVGGQELGYLPGTEAEKMGPWGAAVFDALQAFAAPEVIRHVMERQMLEVLPLTHIRGRTFTDTIMIIDEAQNLERPVLLSALSRLGSNSRVFLTHDVAQRDNLRVGRHDGVAAVVERLKGERLFAHVTLSKSERSEVAALVTSLLDDFDV